MDQAKTKPSQVRDAPRVSPQDVANAKLAVEQAGVAAATADLRGAQAKLDQLVAGASASDKDQAESAVSSAIAAQAQTRRSATEAALAVAAARSQCAETAVAQAKIALEHATLRAPFDGLITSVSIRAGEYVASGTVAVTVADLTVLKVETKDLDESAVARIQEG